MKITKFTKQWLSVLLCLALIVSGITIPVKTVQAEETIVIENVVITNLTLPEPDEPFDTEATATTEGVRSKVDVSWKTQDINAPTGSAITSLPEATGNADWGSIYIACLTLVPEAGYEFSENVIINSDDIGIDTIEENGDGSVTAYSYQCYTRKKPIKNVVAPSVPKTFDRYYESEEDVLASSQLGETVVAKIESVSESETVEMAVEWNVVNEEGYSVDYDPTPGNVNIFSWEVKNWWDYPYLFGDSKMREGTFSIQNKDYTEVAIEASDVSVPYNAKPMDVCQYFNIDAHAGKATYELLDTSTGIGSLDGTNLVVDEVGTFDIQVRTEKNGVYAAGTKTITITVLKGEPYIKTTPTATITYGEELSNDVLNGGVAQCGETETCPIEGTFSWKESGVKPTVADSEKTLYVVQFVPEDETNWNVVEIEIMVTVNPAQNTPNIPSKEMTVSYSTETVGEITLLDWVWQDEDKTKVLEEGKVVTATAVYNGADKGNYVTEQVEISITREEAPVIPTSAPTAAPTVAPTAMPTTPPVISQPSSTPIVSQPTAIPIVPQPTVTPAGVQPTVAPSAAEPTVAPVGVQPTPTPSAENEKTDPVGAKIGTKLVAGSGSGKATYKVTARGEVEYVAPSKKTITAANIPATIKIDGITYKVTSIAKNAFKGCKKLKSVTIGKNVKKIAAKAFWGCSVLKKLTIQSTKLKEKNIGSKAFGKTRKKMIVKVPKKQFKTYKKMLLKRGVSKGAKFKK
nr:leucine-rich repeat protein [Eubacterium sp.]